MGTQMKGNETKGGETAIILATMDGSRGFKRKGKRQKRKEKKKVPWGCCGRVNFHSGHPNYVLPCSPWRFHNKLELG
jgi:hypothetical protein